MANRIQAPVTLSPPSRQLLEEGGRIKDRRPQRLDPSVSEAKELRTRV